MSKPKRIEAIYGQYAEITISDVESELGIKWDDVQEYEIRWGVLQLAMKNDRQLEYHGMEWGEADTKTPDEVWEYGENYSKNVVPNWRGREVSND